MDSLNISDIFLASMYAVNIASLLQKAEGDVVPYLISTFFAIFIVVLYYAIKGKPYVPFSITRRRYIFISLYTLINFIKNISWLRVVAASVFVGAAVCGFYYLIPEEKGHIEIWVIVIVISTWLFIQEHQQYKQKREKFRERLLRS